MLLLRLRCSPAAIDDRREGGHHALELFGGVVFLVAGTDEMQQLMDDGLADVEA